MAKSSKKAAKKRVRKKKLLIVESPAKAKTIEKYLGSGYMVSASMGHLIDLPKSRIAIDVDKGFEPEYITVRGKAKILKELQSMAKKSSQVLLASDNDREGEAISYHLEQAIAKKNPDVEIKRIVFNEITPNAIREAVAHPGVVDLQKVKAQKARRVLDRLVGYNLSPLLWKKVKNGLSAGRVQSVALHLICEREREVEAFIPEEYWTIDAELAKGRSKFTVQLFSINGKKASIPNEETAKGLVERFSGKAMKVINIKKTDKNVRPRPPFITSTLQQTAANRLGFTSRKTMRIAQQLYEGVALGTGRIGLITYMRTDSTRISNLAMNDVRDYISGNYPEALPDKPNYYSKKKGSQDAHEAVRPTYVTNNPASIKEYLTKDQYRLYSIIWERFVGSQMTNGLSRTTSVELQVENAVFRVAGTVMVEKGFQQAYSLLLPRDKKKKLPSINEGDEFDVKQYLPEKHLTSGPSRYTDASIVKTLEEKRIGRPSTYAPIISVLLDRYYVVRKSKQLKPTTLGRIIDDMLSKQFPEIVNPDFTATLEEELDQVEENKKDWVKTVGEFYSPFIKQVDHVMETLESIKGVLDEPTDYTCEKCGRQMIKKLGRYGFFLACSGFPECMNTKSVPLADCPRPDCDGQIIARKKQGGRGKEFYGCTNYPDCDFLSHEKPTNTNCPKCGYFFVEKSDKKHGVHKVCSNPECGFLHFEEEENTAT